MARCTIHTVYPKKYAHGFCFAVLCCGYTLTDFPISIRLTSLALWQSNDCPSASKAALMNMDKYFMRIHYERLHNHNKAKHNKTVCIFLGIYCKSVLRFLTSYGEYWMMKMSWHGNVFQITVPLPVNGGFPSQRAVIWSFNIFFVDTVETLYSTIYYIKYFIELNIDKSTLYVALWTHKRHPTPRPLGELWSVFYEYFNRNWSCYKGFLLYTLKGLEQMVVTFHRCS